MFDSYSICSLTNIICGFLDIEYENTELKVVMNEQCQNIDENEGKRFLDLLLRF